jgi:uncharacterized Ntn-hydrolase superfamily protein
MLRADKEPDRRQVAIIDIKGRSAAWTSPTIPRWAGHRCAPRYCVQGNTLAGEKVIEDMAAAFERATGPLAERMLAGLDAAEAAGGDIRGKQGAAIYVVKPLVRADYDDTLVDIRVDDHPEPLAELERLLDLSDAYALATQGDDLVGQGRHDEAADRYTRAAALAPDNHELLFWSGLAAARGGDMDTALQRVRRAIELQPGWRDLLGRLEPDIAPAAAAVQSALERA